MTTRLRTLCLYVRTPEACELLTYLFGPGVRIRGSVNLYEAVLMRTTTTLPLIAIPPVGHVELGLYYVLYEEVEPLMEVVRRDVRTVTYVGT